jgi:hypothetical protein
MSCSGSTEGLLSILRAAKKQEDHQLHARSEEINGSPDTDTILKSLADLKVRQRSEDWPSSSRLLSTGKIGYYL